MGMGMRMGCGLGLGLSQRVGVVWATLGAGSCWLRVSEKSYIRQLLKKSLERKTQCRLTNYELQVTSYDRPQLQMATGIR